MAVEAHTNRDHHRRRLAGRDPGEESRTATPLELLFDLTFVVAFGVASDELARYLAEGTRWPAIGAFAFTSFAVAWAWVNYSWFASAYDTDDWVFRLATMVQMVGVIVLALGIEQAFASIVEGKTLDNGVMVAGYVVMRASMVFLWAQVARDDPARRGPAGVYIRTIAVAQVFWVVLAVVDLPLEATFAVALLLIGLEMSGPLIAERRYGGTPWHAHHIAERYGLLVIITLGEGILGTVASINAVVHGSAGWTVTAAVVATAGIGLIFGTWWTYFAIPWAEVLQLHRERAFVWSYGHLVLFGALAAIGSGLHVAAYRVEHKTTLGETGTVLCVVVPVAIYVLAFYGLYAWFTRHLDPFHLSLLAGSAAVLGLAVGSAALGASLAVCLLVVMFTPIVTVVGYETLGHRHVQDALARMAVGDAAVRP
jgi:low temperature requirement protein LtrA